MVEYNISNVHVIPSLDQSPLEPSSPPIDSFQHRMPTNSLVMVNPLLQILLPHLLIPRLLVKVIQVGPLLSEKVLVPLEMHIPFIIFLAIIYYRLPLVHFYPQCPLLLFLKM